MEEKFLKEQIEKENIKIPEKLRPENIGSLLDDSAAGEKPDSGKKPKMSWLTNGRIRRFAAAAAGVLVLFTVVTVGMIAVKSGKKADGESRDERTKVTYEDIYKALTKNGSLWGASYEKNILYAIPENSGEGSWDYIQNEDGGMLNDAALSPTESEGELSYSRTNIQESGVDEGDLFRTDGEYIYILKRTNSMTDKPAGILIVRAEGEKLSTAADIEAPVPEGCGNQMYYEEMYVDNDRLIVTGMADIDNEDSFLSFASVYDISDKEQPKLLDTVTQSGIYISSRKSGDVLYMVSDYGSEYLREIKEWDYYSYIPCCGGELVPADDIYCPDEGQYRGYTTVCSIDIREPHVMDTEAVMADCRNMYMSRNAIYFLSWMSKPGGKKEIDDEKYKYDMSFLTKFTYKDGQIEYAGETQVPGYADDQFSFNEYGEYLRLVTTSNRYKRRSGSDGWLDGFAYGNLAYGNFAYGNFAYGYDTTVSGLYIFDAGLNLVGSVEDLALGERVKSSRFIGDMAYIVTFRQTDPLFAIDTSNPAEPVIKSELKISGFSEYMHPYGDGKMLGIGYEADENTGWTECIKISMFDVSDSGNVTEESRFLLTDAEYAGVLRDHKALMIDTERNLFGFAVTCSDYNAMGYRQARRVEYRVFSYEEGEGFKELINCGFEPSESMNYYYFDGYPGALYIGDYLYIIDGDYNIKIYDLTDYH